MKMPLEIYSGIWNGGHCQGIAVDTKREYIYYSYTTMLVKTDLQGKIIGTVTGLLGHLGCIDFCDADGRLYGSLEYKNDAIGQGILKHLGSDAKLENAFYIAIFDVDKIDRVGMDATADGVMTTVYLKEVVEDYQATVTNQGKSVAHRLGCSGIDGTTFGKIPGDPSGKYHLFVAYGIYSDVERTDNDYQVILCFDTETWKQYEQPLYQASMHHCGPEKPDHKFFLYTGNTNWGIQNMEYDEATGNFLLAVYRGKKPQYKNWPMFIIDGSKAPKREVISGVEPALEGETLTLLGDGYSFPYGSTGLYSLGDGRFYVSHDGRTPEGYDTHVKLYRWNGTDPLILETEENSMYEELKKISQEAYDYLTGDPKALPDGKHQLGNGTYVALSSYDSKLRKNAKYEAHIDYIDIQVILEGQEIIAVEPLEVMHQHPCLQPYNPEKDVELYANNLDGIDYVLNAGDYLVLNPEDGHMPGICVGGPSPIRKAVIKVPVKK